MDATRAAGGASLGDPDGIAVNEAPPAVAQTLAAEDARRIAVAFLPTFPLGNRYDYYYVRAKLRSDPLYPGVLAALRGCEAPLIDLGCGLGLLAHALRGDGRAIAYLGVDDDEAKLARARRAAARRGFAEVRFERVDLSRGAPPHRGSVALLDVLQYLDADAREALLATAVAMLDPGARLVIRSPIDDGGGRARIGRVVDGLAHRIGWMRFRPRAHPTLDALCAPLQRAGLRVERRPLHGRTPFNNWLIVAERVAA